MPRAWLADGKRVAVERAPTYFGPASIALESAADRGWITAHVEFEGDRRPNTVLVRLRHPDRKPIRSVTVNGVEWMDFDASREWIRLGSPAERRLTLVARY